MSRSRSRRLVGALAGVALLAPTLPSSAVPSGVATPAGVLAAPPTLVSVGAVHDGDVDRVTFRFEHGRPTDVDLRWVDALHADGSGRRLRIAGESVLQVVLHGMVASDESGSTTPSRQAFALPNVLTAVRAGDFEAVVSYGLGVQRRAPFRAEVLRSPDRLVIEVMADRATTPRRVWLLDAEAYRTGEGPYVVPRRRVVPADAPAAGVLHALFAGSTRAELAGGLRLVRSRAWGFTDLRIADGIARVRLTRGCRSGGSTITLANLMTPTLKQFPTVDWVKIYSPEGRTERPHGRVDSIPACLEP